MSGRSKIRWQKSDIDELNRLVKNFNAKITRIEKKNPELANALPEKLSAKQMKEMISSRQDLKRELNALQRFTSKENVIRKTDDGSYEGIEIHGDYNIKVTTWQRKEINRRLVAINKRREERLKKFEQEEMTSRGEKLNYKVVDVGMGRAEILELLPMEGLTPGISQIGVKLKYKSILQESQSNFFMNQDKKLRENYIKGLAYNYNENDIKEIRKKIEEMPLEEFLKIYRTDQNAKFSELYYPSYREYKKTLNTLQTVWLPNKRAD